MALGHQLSCISYYYYPYSFSKFISLCFPSHFFLHWSLLVFCFTGFSPLVFHVPDISFSVSSAYFFSFSVSSAHFFSFSLHWYLSSRFPFLCSPLVFYSTSLSALTFPSDCFSLVSISLAPLLSFSCNAFCISVIQFPKSLDELKALSVYPVLTLRVLIQQ